ncbi:MAG: MerC domain-containing protein [Novosphingobium sp.]
MTKAFTSIRERLDRTGIFISGLCAVHCLASLLLVSVLGLGGQLLLAPAIHRVGLGVAIAVGAVTLGIGIYRHGQVWPLLVGSVGLMLMTAGLLVPHGAAEAILTIAGVGMVASAHILNLRLAR